MPYSRGWRARTSTWWRRGPWIGWDRSLKHLLDILDELDAKGIDLYFDQQTVDTSTPGGRALSRCGCVRQVRAQHDRGACPRRVEEGESEGHEVGTPVWTAKISAEVVGKIREQLAQVSAFTGWPGSC